MTMLMVICALFLSAIGVLFAAASGDMVYERRAGLLAIAFSAFILVVASALWVAVGFRMAGM